MDSKVKIVVCYGDYSSAKAASIDEKNIDWWNEEDKNATICTESFAAIELRKHLCMLLNVDVDDDKVFPICKDDTSLDGDIILIGNKFTNRGTAKYWSHFSEEDDNTFDQLPREGFIVKSLEDHTGTKLLLAGKDRVGTLYAVYSLLEKFGIRWYGFGDTETHYGNNQAVTLNNWNYDEIPDFITRGGYSEFIDDSNQEFIDWLTRNRVNFVALDHINNPHNLKKRGIQICMGGHHLTYEHLNPNTLFDGEEMTYSQKHPEWYGLINGKRSFDIGNGGQEGYGHNYCTTNEEATHMFCTNIIESLISGKLKHTDYLNFWLLDNGRWCECEQCTTTGNYAFRLTLVIHQLNKLIQKARDEKRLKRDIKILFPAYHETLPSPNNPLPEDFDYERCIVTYFPIERCFVHKLNDIDCTETNQDLIASYIPWTPQGGGHYKGSILIGEYYNVSSFAACHIPLMQIMKQDIPFYYNTGARHMHYMHMTDRRWGGLRLTNYQLQKMLWNHDLDVDQLLTDYFKSFYCEVSDLMEQYYQVLEEAMKNAKALKHYQYHENVRHQLSTKLIKDEEQLFPLKHLQYDEVLNDSNAGISVTETIKLIKKCRNIIDQALYNCETDVVLKRVLADEARFSYTEDMIHFIYYLIRTNMAKCQGKHILAKRSLARASSYADNLKANTEEVYPTRRFNLFDNGLLASWCEPAYRNYCDYYANEKGSDDI